MYCETEKTMKHQLLIIVNDGNVQLQNPEKIPDLRVAEILGELIATEYGDQPEKLQLILTRITNAYFSAPSKSSSP